MQHPVQSICGMRFKYINVLGVVVPKILFTCIFAFDTLEPNASLLPLL
jgi:hypothetical protein